MASLGLCVITDRYTQQLAERIADIARHFDAIYVQVNGEKPPKQVPGGVQFSGYKWNDNFADARNALLSRVKTDYWVWLDNGDELTGVENLSKVVEHMDSNGVEIMFAPYEYMHDDAGNVTELQNRERIVKTSLKGQWHGAVHETFIPEVSAVRETTDLVVWSHVDHDRLGSMKRNRRILEAEYAKEPRDPRIAYYLGMNYGMDGHYTEAIQCFQELIDTGGWAEERYRSYLQIFSCCFEQPNYDGAISAALKATTELPDWPDAYYMLQQVYYQLDEHEKSLEWFKIARSKPEPETDSARNPVVTQLQPLRLAAHSYMVLGEPKTALTVAQELLRKSPSYDLGPLKQIILDAVNEENAIDAVRFLADYLETDDARRLLAALPGALRADVRLTDLRRRLIPGKKWPEDSIVFYCGSSYEPWGPETLENGMGGSEEAVVYLSRELAEAGKEVWVYNERTDGISEMLLDVTYYPWTEINPNDVFDVFVAWRNPQVLKDIKARKKLCDIHDIIPRESVYEAIPYTDAFLFKTQYHRDLYPEVPDDKAVIIGNGINKDQFK